MLRLLSMVFILGFCLGAGAVDKQCRNQCTPQCSSQVERTKQLISSHEMACREMDSVKRFHKCAYKCNKECRDYVRRKRKTIGLHYDTCGGGSGEYGSLYCALDNKDFFVFNSHNEMKLGLGHKLKSACEESANTLTKNVFCRKTLTGYGIVHFSTGERLGLSKPFLSNCREQLDNIYGDYICVRINSYRHKVFDLYNWELVDPGKSYLSLQTCVESLMSN